MIAKILNFVWIGILLVIAFVALGWFISNNNAAMAGQTTGDFFSSVHAFITNMIKASPLG